jgi:hypothetical protein
MTSVDPAADRRLRGTPASKRSLEIAAAATVAIIVGCGVAGLWLAPLLFIAVGAGAGYSLSGSV